MSDTGICPHCGKDFMHDAQNTVCPHCQGKVYPNVRALIKDYDEQALYGVGLLCDEDCVITDGSRMRVKFCWDENDPSYDGDITKYCENHLAQRYVNGQVVSTMDTSAYVVNYYGIARRRVVAPDGHMLGFFQPQGDQPHSVEKKRAKKLEAQRYAEDQKKWEAAGLCRYCGGKFGMFGKTCKACGKKN